MKYTLEIYRVYSNSNSCRITRRDNIVDSKNQNYFQVIYYKNE